MSQGTLIEKVSYDLGLMVAANMPTCGIPLAVQEFYLINRHLIPEALLRGFILPQQEPNGSVPPKVPTFKTTNTDLAVWITKAEEFSEKYLGVKVSLREMFAIPEDLPWPNAIPVFDPGGDFTNREAVELLKKLRFAVWEEVDVMRYSGSGASVEPTLRLVQNSVWPDEDTFGMSPDKLVATGKNWLDLRGYALAFGLHHFITQKYLDPKTFTWFPNIRLSSGLVAYGSWDPDGRRVGFCWNDPGGSGPNGGARLAIRCSLKP